MPVVRRAFLATAVAAVALAAFMALRLFMDNMDSARDSAVLGSAMSLASMVQSYTSQHGSFPAAGTELESEASSSWRTVLIMNSPYSGEDSYDFARNWQAEENRTFAITASPFVYSPSRQKTDEGVLLTEFVAVVGEDTLLRPAKNMDVASISDGPQNTIAFLQVRDPNIPWTKPKDLTKEAVLSAARGNASSKKSSTHFVNQRIVFADSSVFRVNRLLDEKQLSALLTPDGGEPILRSELEASGYLVEE